MSHVAADDRSVSPVIGVVLMIAVTVTLVAVVAPVVFAVSNSAGESPPEADFTFFYAESEAGTEDSFGNDGGDGLLTIGLESGSAIPAEELSIVVESSGGELVDTDAYDSGDEMLPGDEITVSVERGDDVRIIWNESGVDNSAILDRFPVPALSA